MAAHRGLYTRPVDEASILDGLTDSQRDAATHLDGPALVLAGPGSGKTRVITRRIAWLVAQGIPPWNILAVTFTNKAAAEMRRRVESLLPPDTPGRRGLVVTTFHSFAARFLREHAVAAGLDPSFAIFDSGDQRDVLKKAIAAADCSTQQWAPAAVSGLISERKNELLTVEAWATSAVDWRERTLLRIWRGYEAGLRRSNALDFDDLLLRTALLLKQDETVRLMARDRFRYLLIDEYQDTNRAQFTIANAIAGEAGNLFTVGDPDQSIYGWRGADLSNILEFERQYPRARVIPLGQNFRSTRRIVDAAAGLIAHNARRKEKRIFSELAEGELVKVVRCMDERHEAETVASAIEQASLDGMPFRSMAVLYRVNALSRVLEEVLRRRGIPYVIARGTAFYERKEIKDALSYLRLVSNPADEVSLRRVVNVPTRGLGDTTLKRVEAWAIDAPANLFEALERSEEIEGVSPRAAAAATKFTRQVRGWQAMAAKEAPELLGDLVSTVLRESGLEAKLTAGDDEEALQRKANLAELVSAASEWSMAEDDSPAETGPTLLDVLRAWLESVALVSDADAIDPDRGSVTLLTLHAAKGLEFPFVAMVGLEQGLLPHQRAESSDDELEEERRLCFVGITRAERRIMMTSASYRTIRGITQGTVESRFVSEIPAELLERSGLGAGRERAPWDRPDRSGAATASRGDDFGGPRIEYVEEASRGGGGLASRFPVGSLVRHAKFGVGRIAAVLPRGRATSVRVDFRHLGAKTLVLEYANLERILD
jgi:DNA helicase II / ATP-dependent DNA helicase PcrA